MSDKNGTIVTEITYNDQAETEIAFQTLVHKGREIHLFEDSGTVMIEMPEIKQFEDLSLMIENGYVEFAHQRGQFRATPIEIYHALNFLDACRQVKQILG